MCARVHAFVHMRARAYLDQIPHKHMLVSYIRGNCILESGSLTLTFFPTGAVSCRKGLLDWKSEHFSL